MNCHPVFNCVGHNHDLTNNKLIKETVLKYVNEAEFKELFTIAALEKIETVTSSAIAATSSAVKASLDARNAVNDLTAQTMDFVNDAINNTAVEGGILADTFVTATASRVNSVARTQRDKNSDMVSVKDFGAVGDGVTDDTQAFKNAIASSLAIYIPEPSDYYLITDTLHLRAGQTFTGWSKVAKTYTIDGVNRRGVHGEMAVLGTPLFQLGNGVDGTLRKMTFNNLSMTCTNGACIKSKYSTEFAAYSCQIGSKHYHAVETENSYLFAFYNCAIGSSGMVGIDGTERAVAWSGFNNSNGVLFSNCRMSGGGVGGVADIGKSYNILFLNSVFESTKYGIRVAGNATNPQRGNVNNFQLINCQFESCKFPLDLGSENACLAPVISGLYITHPYDTTATEFPAIKLGRVNALTMSGLNLTLGKEQYAIEFSYSSSAANQGSMARLTNSILGKANIERVDSGFLFKHTGFSNVAQHSALADNVIEINPTNIFGREVTYTSERIICKEGMSKIKIASINPITGSRIIKVELIGCKGALDGILGMGTDVSWSENIFLTLPSDLVIAEGYVDITNKVNKKDFRAGGALMLTHNKGALESSGSFIVRITYSN